MAELNLTPEEMEQLAKFLVEWKEQYSFHGTHINQDNLDRFNQAATLGRLIVAKTERTSFVSDQPDSSACSANFEIIIRRVDRDDDLFLGLEARIKQLFTAICELVDEVDFATDVDQSGEFMSLSFFVDVFEK